MTLSARTAKHSQDYVEKLASLPKLSKAEKQQRLAAILADKASGMHRLGQGMIGPIQIRLRYEGMVRNVLLEDTLERGPLMPYDILDDLGMAYILNSTDSEVKVQVFEGKQAFPALFRIAAFPRIRKEDLYYLRVNAVEYAQDESRQAIQKQEDYKLIQLLEAAIVEHGAAAQRPVGGEMTGIAQGPSGFENEKTVVIGANNPLEPVDFYSAVAMIEVEQLEAKRVLIHPTDVRDLYTWDINVTGWTFKDKVFAGETITSFGEFQVQKSVMVPQGEVFLTAEPEFVGVFPVMYSLDVEENHQVEQFYKGWVMDELVGMMVLNARGLARIQKSASRAASGIITNLAERGLYT
ncbi:MAG: HK97-fold major capsid protein [Nitrososphaerales archaeon]